MTPKGFPERNVISHAGMGELKPDSQNKHPETIKKKKTQTQLFRNNGSFFMEDFYMLLRVP